jgi:uncharacterized protein YjbJ (UPF0337 family)
MIYGRAIGLSTFRPCRRRASPAMFAMPECAKFGAPPRNQQENSAMDRNRVIGSAKEAKGALKQAAGKLTGDAKLQADGKADKAEGKVQNAIGGAMDSMWEALKK